MNSLVQNLERALLVEFHNFSKRLVTEFPNVTTQVRCERFEGRGGCHVIYVDCLIPGIVAERPDNVGLSVEVYDLRSSPLINADVCWGHPSGHIEDEFSAEALTLSEDTILQLNAVLPRLLSSLHDAIKRGKPSVFR